MEDDLDIGLCEEHDRLYEAICEQCFVPVCPKCVMFSATHKQHPVLELPQAAAYLRSQLNTQLQKGSLKIDHTEGVLLDIRQASLTCEQQKGKMIQRINKIFQDLARTLKARKTELLTQIEESFENEREKIVENEEVWKKKQVICEELLRLNGTESGNKDILLNSKYIMEGIKEISTPITFQDMKLVHSLGDHLKVEADEEGDLTLEMLLKLLSEYVQPTEYKTLQYRS